MIKGTVREKGVSVEWASRYKKSQRARKLHASRIQNCCAIKSFLRDTVQVMCLVVTVLVMDHGYRQSWKRLKDADGIIERERMQLGDTILTLSNFISANGSANTYLRKINLLPNQ